MKGGENKMVKKITTFLLLIVILTPLFIVVFSTVGYAKGNPHKIGPNSREACWCDRMGTRVCVDCDIINGQWVCGPPYPVGCCTYPCPLSIEEIKI